MRRSQVALEPGDLPAEHLDLGGGRDSLRGPETGDLGLESLSLHAAGFRGVRLRYRSVTPRYRGTGRYRGSGGGVTAVTIGVTGRYGNGR